MKIKKSKAERFLRVSAIGDMEAYDAERFENEVFACINKGDKNIILDLGELVYICSSGLRALLNIRTRLEKEGGRLVLTSLKEKVLEVLRISKLLGIFEIVKDPKDIEGIS
ncbi:MAG: STAS domain-containing protein [Candidatus Omnitrophota bacterium]